MGEFCGAVAATAHRYNTGKYRTIVTTVTVVWLSGALVVDTAGRLKNA
jgi:hypothetical protein